MKIFIEGLYDLDLNLREYEIAITNKINSKLSENDLKVLNKYLEDENNELKNRFTAFFTIFTCYRRNRNIKNIEILLNGYKSIFQSYDILKHVELLYKSLIASNVNDLEEVMIEANDFIESHPIFQKHVGVLHLYCHAVVNYFEAKESKVDLEKESNKYHLDNAKKHMSYVISNSKYAKFYSTNGRLYLLSKDYKKTIDNFVEAEFSENIHRSDYSIVMAGYKDYILYAKQLIQTEEIKLKSAELEEKAKQVEFRIKKLNANNIKLISMFTGIITLVIGNISIASSSNATLEAMYILNGMFFVFFGITLLGTKLIIDPVELDKEKPKKIDYLTFAAAAIILLGLAILVVIFIKEII